MPPHHLRRGHFFVQKMGSTTFVGILSDANARTRLEELKEADADEDKVYQQARELSHSFRDGLLEFFFDTESEIDDLTKNYGVF